MDFPINPLFIVLVIWAKDNYIILVTACVRLTAINNSRYVEQLYQKLHNEGAPFETDRAKSDAQIRRELCDDIICNTFFYRSSHELFHATEMYRDLHHPKFSDVFDEIFESHEDPKYVNLFRHRKFVKDDFHFGEYVFLCPLRDLSNDEPTIPVYVSKEYNVGPFGDPYLPGRFLIVGPIPDEPSSGIELMLAEQPVSVYGERDFNVELHYLRLRKHMKPATINKVDPLCKLISRRSENPYNQHHRFCVAVARSSYFEDDIQYPEEFSFACHEERVSFKSEEALKVAEGEFFYERMTRCYSKYEVPPHENIDIYISRAYFSNAVFVFTRDPWNGKIYLENLSFNIGVVDELNSFDFVEE